MDDDDGGKVVIVGVCAMEKKTQSKPMKEILTRLQEFEYIKVIVFEEEVIILVRMKLQTLFFYKWIVVIYRSPLKIGPSVIVLYLSIRKVSL